MTNACRRFLDSADAEKNSARKRCKSRTLTASEGLGKLLDNCDFLQHVSKHLLLRDLGTARLVCQSWRDACSRLLLELGDGKGCHARAVMAAFPYARSMTVQIGEDAAPEDALRLLRDAPNLNRLVLKCDSAKWPNPEATKSDVRGLRRLMELRLEQWKGLLHPSAWPLLCSMHQLRRLQVFAPLDSLDGLKEIAALTALEELTLQFRLDVAPPEQVSLPFLPSIRHLAVGTSYKTRTQEGLNLLEVVLEYGPTLRSLRLTETGKHCPFHDFALLGRFVALERFALDCDYADADLCLSTALIDALSGLPNLTEVALNIGSCLSPALVDSLSSVRNLQKLEFTPCLMHYTRNPPPQLSTLRSLTSLTLRFVHEDTSLEGLANLKELKILNRAEYVADLEQSLRAMQKLEILTLEFDRRRRQTIPRSVLSSLKKLKSAQISGAQINENA